MASATRALPGLLRLLHGVIIVNFVLQIGYGFYQTFFIVRPEGMSGPLFGAAKALGFEMMTTRRLYASETWIAITGLALYLAVTEFLPRQIAAILEREGR
ncbi:MAG: hypothetical protein KC466_01320 [Myxococcales bacterium]|nr:hypothetical protein [Myxococcales bacterium]